MCETYATWLTWRLWRERRAYRRRPDGRAGIDYWAPIAEEYGLNLETVNPVVDPTFSFMTVDWDRRIRMDCSSPYAMASLVGMKDRFDIAFGNDPDADRHGIVTAAPADEPQPLFGCGRLVSLPEPARPFAGASVGKTLVSSSMIDRAAASIGRDLREVPVGFKWFVDGLLDGSLASAARRAPALPSCAWMGRCGRQTRTDSSSTCWRRRSSPRPPRPRRALRRPRGAGRSLPPPTPYNDEQKAALANLSPEMVTATEMAGEPITAS